MKNLFLVSRSPFLRNEARLDVRLAEEGDAVCCIQDGVYGAYKIPDGLQKELESAQTRGVKFFALKEDLLARGLSPSNLFIAIDYDRLIELILNYKRIIS